MPEKIYMILHDTSKKGREIFIGQDTKPQHKYADSGVERLVKLTVIPGGWKRFWRATKVIDQIWVSFSGGPEVLNVVWYPLQLMVWDVWIADWRRSEVINKAIRDRLNGGL